MPVLVISLGLWCRSQPSCGGIFLVLFHCLLHPHPPFSREFNAGPGGAVRGAPPCTWQPRELPLHQGFVSSKQSFSFPFQS